MRNVMRRRRTTPHEKGYTQSSEIEEEKTTNCLLCKNVRMKLYSGVWTNHSMLPKPGESLSRRARRIYCKRADTTLRSCRIEGVFFRERSGKDEYRGHV